MREQYDAAAAAGELLELLESLPRGAVEASVRQMRGYIRTGEWPIAHFNRLQQHGGPVLQAIEARRGVVNGDPPPRRDSAAGGAPRRSNNVKEAFTGLESMNLSPADDVAAHAAEGVLRATARVHISMFGGGGGAATGVALANQSSSFRENYRIKARLHGGSDDGLPPALDGLKIVAVDSNAEALKIAALNLPPGTETVEHFITPDNAVPPGTCRDLVEAGRRPFSMDFGPPAWQRRT